jgi:hypothetical protein
MGIACLIAAGAMAPPRGSRTAAGRRSPVPGQVPGADLRDSIGRRCGQDSPICRLPGRISHTNCGAAANGSPPAPSAVSLDGSRTKATGPLCGRRRRPVLGLTLRPPPRSRFGAGQQRPAWLTEQHVRDPGVGLVLDSKGPRLGEPPPPQVASPRERSDMPHRGPPPPVPGRQRPEESL